jgi:hypothetical protein
MTHRMSRRDFLGLAGLSAVAASLSCAGGLLGYLALRYATRPDPAAAPTPPSTPSLTRPAWIKRIDRPPIIARADWNARAPNHEAENEPGFYSLSNIEGWRDYEGDLRAIYRTVVVHHSALYQGDDLTTMQEIQNQHMDKRKWADIGYHFGVGLSGEVYEGRALITRGTHVEHFNTGTVGVVFFGNFQVQEPTPEQLDAGRHLMDWLALRLELTHLAGHHEFNDFTECPGIRMIPYLVTFAASAGLVLGTGGYEPPPEQLITPTPPPAP